MIAQGLERETDHLLPTTLGQASRSGLWERRAMECLAMGMIGDGALAFVEPRRHAELWLEGPAMWQQLIRPFAQRPRLTRWLGAAEIAIGFWLASRQDP